MDWLDFLVRFIKFFGVMAVSFFGYRWLAKWGKFPEDVNNIVYTVMAVVGLIILVLEFLKPLLRL